MTPIGTPFAQQRDAEHAMDLEHPRVVFRCVVGVGPGVHDLNGKASLHRRASYQRSSTGLDCLLPLEMFIGRRNTVRDCEAEKCAIYAFRNSTAISRAAENLRVGEYDPAAGSADRRPSG